MGAIGMLMAVITATIAISKPPAALEKLPYDILQFIEHLADLPYDAGGDIGPGE